MSDEHIVSRIMDKAQEADRLALFAAVQAAVLAIVDIQHRPNLSDHLLARVERALDVGAPYGSPGHLAFLDSETPTEPPRTDYFIGGTDR